MDKPKDYQTLIDQRNRSGYFSFVTRRGGVSPERGVHEGYYNNNPIVAIDKVLKDEDKDDRA